MQVMSYMWYGDIKNNLFLATKSMIQLPPKTKKHISIPFRNFLNVFFWKIISQCASPCKMVLREGHKFRTFQKKGQLQNDICNMKGFLKMGLINESN
jgi:hypothetical protein